MTDVIGMIDPVSEGIIDQQQIAEQMLELPKTQGRLESSTEVEMTEHLGYEKHSSSSVENAPERFELEARLH